MNEFIPIMTQRLLIRDFRPEDGEDLYAYLSDERVYQFEPGAPLDHAQAQKRANEFAFSPAFWAVELLADHKVIGQIYFEQIEPHHLLTWEIGYIFNPNYQRQGFASEAVAALVRYGFNGETHRVVAHCNPENIASWKLLEKVGFRREGLHKQENFFHRDVKGEPIWIDTFVYALLKEDIP